VSPSQNPEPDPFLEEISILSEEVRILRMAVDELTEAVKWQNNNAEDYPALLEGRSKLWSLAHVTLPELLSNCEYTPPKEEEQSVAPPSARPAGQQKLF